MRKCSLFLILFFAFYSAFTQSVYPFWDQFNIHFRVYDGGVTRVIETIPVKSHKSGVDYVAYVTDMKDFKIYSNGSSRTVSRFEPVNYEAADHLVVYANMNEVMAFYQGRITKICAQCRDFKLVDSMIVFTDNRGFLKAWYDGSSTQLEINSQIDYKVGRNLVAFVDRNNLLKVFYHDTIMRLEVFSDSTQFKIGAGIVTYLDRNQQLKVFYGKKTYTLDRVRPISYEAGDNMVAFVDINSNFKVFHKGNLFQLETFIPSSYTIVEGILYYRDNLNQLKVFENGKGRVIDTWFPSEVSIRNTTMVYKDFRNRIKMYQPGKDVIDVSVEQVTSFKALPELVIYTTGAKTTVIWDNGNITEIVLN